MALPLEEVRRIATLARLELSAAESLLFAEQLGRVVDYIDQLGRFETSHPPEACLMPLEAPDAIAASLATEVVLANAPDSREAFVVVPRILASPGAPSEVRDDG